MKMNIRMLGVIAATMFVGFPVSVNGMSARPPIIFEQTEAGLYLQKDLRQGSKTLVHDKNGSPSAGRKRAIWTATRQYYMI
jgi:hypothetical protein